jgi:hypothetical protein
MFGAQRIPVDLQCRVCPRLCKIEIDLEDLSRWEQGEMIQYAFADALGKQYLTPAERELLMSGLCDLCLQKLFEGPVRVMPLAPKQGSTTSHE